MKSKQTGKARLRRIRFKYKLAIINEHTLEEVFGLRLSRLNAIPVALTAIVVVFVAASFILVATPLHNYLPGYMNSDVREQVVNNALRVDSLQQLLDRQNLYIMNIQDIFLGQVRADTISTIDSRTLAREDTLMERTQRELEFRRQYEEAEKYNLTTINAESESGGLIFHSPTRGMIVAGFDATARHYGTDIAARAGESVLATLEGTVVWSTYTAEGGYVVAIQHGRDFLSVYKHCGSLLKRTGDTVAAGEAIAVVGSTGTEANSPHLHFELWYRGRPVNAELYVVF